MRFFRYGEMRVVIGAIVGALLASCTTAPMQPPPPSPVLDTPAVAFRNELASFTPVPFSALPGWAADDLQGVWQAWQANCSSARIPAKIQSACAAARGLGGNPPKQVLRFFFEQQFEPLLIQSLVQSTDSKDEGLLTGYYEPILKGSRTPSAQFPAPLYARPADMLSSPSGDIARSRNTGTGTAP